MGEAKRRKQLGFGYIKRTELGCFIAKTYVGDTHAVYLGIGAKNGSHDLVHLSSHADILEAYEILGDCKKILKKIEKHLHGKNSVTIHRIFVDAVKAELGIYPSDDGVFAISENDEEVMQEWTAAGNRIGIDPCPPGVKMVVIKPHLFKEWQIVARLVDGYKASPYGDPSADHQFFIKRNNGQEPFLIKVVEQDKIVTIPPCSRYVSAAYIADFINKHEKSFLTSEELIRLLVEANTLQSRVSKQTITGYAPTGSILNWDGSE